MDACMHVCMLMQAEGHIMANFYMCFAVFITAPLIQYALINKLQYGFFGAGAELNLATLNPNRNTRLSGAHGGLGFRV